MEVSGDDRQSREYVGLVVSEWHTDVAGAINRRWKGDGLMKLAGRCEHQQEQTIVSGAVTTGWSSAAAAAGSTYGI